MITTFEDYQTSIKNRWRWASVGAFSEEEYKENVKRNNALQGYIAHLRDRTYVKKTKQICSCNSSYGCVKCNPSAYAGEGYYSNDPEVTS